MIVCFDGSPRREATSHVLSEVTDRLEETDYEVEILDLRGREINFCKHCDYCLREKKCVFDDGMSEVYSALERATGLVFATPVYNSGITAQLKAMIDRTRAFLAKDPDGLKGKVGMGIAVGGDRVGGQEVALMQIHAFFILNGVIPVSGGPFGANLGATFWSKDTKEGVVEDEEGYKSLDKTLKRFVEFVDEYGREK